MAENLNFVHRVLLTPLVGGTYDLVWVVESVSKVGYHTSWSRVLYTPSSRLELCTESVFFGRYRSVFLGIYHTDTGGKLGRYISASKRGQLPLFPEKGGNAPLLEEPNLPFQEKRGERYKTGGNDTDHKYWYGANLIPVKYRYQKNDSNHHDTTLS